MGTDPSLTQASFDTPLTSAVVADWSPIRSMSALHPCCQGWFHLEARHPAYWLPSFFGPSKLGWLAAAHPLLAALIGTAAHALNYLTSVSDLFMTIYSSFTP